MAFLKKSIRDLHLRHALFAVVLIFRYLVELSLLGREGQDKVSGEITRKRSMRLMPADASSVRVNSHAKSGNRRGPTLDYCGAAKQQPCDQRRFPVAPACQARAQGATETVYRVVASTQASFPPRNKKGFTSSSEASDQHNVACLGATSKHKIESICGESKAKDEIRFEVG